MRGTFKPNTDCTLIKRATTDKYGETVDAPPRPARCSVVHLQWQSSKTLFSRVHSGTAGSARENTAVSTLLFAPDAGVEVGDRIQFAQYGMTIVVGEIQPRHDVHGRLHHWEVKGGAA